MTIVVIDNKYLLRYSKSIEKQKCTKARIIKISSSVGRQTIENIFGNIP